MKRISLSLLLVTALGLVACGGSSRVPSAAVQNAGIIATYRDGNSVTILYQESSTSSDRLMSEANRICGVSGQRAGSSQTVRASGASKIPGVDRQVVFQCI